MANLSNLARFEFKYAISPDLMKPIQAFVQSYCAIDPNGHPENGGFYKVDSLYLDADDYRTYWDTEDKAPVRAKLRVRTYPDAPNEIVKFEVKRRVRDFVLKTAAVVPKQGWAEWLHFRGETRRPALDEFIVMAQTMNARPKMLVRYERLAFLSMVDDNVRITVDRNMVHQPMSRYSLDGWPDHWTAMDDEESMGVSSDVMLELKFANRAPVWMADLVRRFGLVRQGYSKYCCAIRRGVMERDIYWDLAPADGPGNWSMGPQWTF